MKEIQYKKFSWDTHNKNWKFNRPNVCQFELTFRCDLHCRHCYAGCYNKEEYIKRELTTSQVKLLIDKVYNSGVMWLCFTGGDPLTRPDFLEIYSYAKDKGFIITIFTNGYSMTEEIANYLKERPPFVIEITLNAVTKKTYEDISHLKGSYEKVMDAIEMIAERKLPLKIKTKVMKCNLEELLKIKEFVENLGLKFRPSHDLYARLNGDLTPCSLRIPPQEVLSLDGNNRLAVSGCRLSPHPENRAPRTAHRAPHTDLFHCVAGGGDGVVLDPYGNMLLCNLIRQPSFNLFEVSIEDAFSRLLPLARGRKFTTDSRCKYCKILEFCYRCPGKALLEKGDMEAPIPYYCELAQLIVRR